MALYEILEDGTPKQIAGSRNIIAQVNPNVDYLKTEIVYDMSSLDPNKNWSYTGGIKAGSVIPGKDFSKYEKLIIYVQFSGQVSGTGFLDLSKTLPSPGTYRTKLAFGSEENTDIYICFVRVSADKTEFANGQMGFLRGSTFFDRGSSYDSYFVYKIEGVLKTPSMIYTGAELFAGDSVDITEGKISIKEKEFFNKIYPVGSIYTSTNPTSPAELFGIGAWEPLKDCFLWANGDTTSITYTENGTSVTKSLTAGSRGGEFSHKLITGEMPSHNHNVKYAKNTTGGNPQENFSIWSWYSDSYVQFSSAVKRLAINATQSSRGSDQVHNNMPPYLSVYMWKRVQE